MKETTVNISKQDIGFSAGHFTIFSKTERERLHGHNYLVSVNITTLIGDDGLSFDYNLFKSKLRQMCDDLDEYVLLPEHSPHLKIIQQGERTEAEFNGEKIPFLSSDVLILPISNTTVEELSHYLLDLLCEDKQPLLTRNISKISLTVQAGHGQSATSTKSL